MKHPPNPMVPIPDPRFTRPFEAYSLVYWEYVAKIMILIGSSREETERFIQQQTACIKKE